MTWLVDCLVLHAAKPWHGLGVQAWLDGHEILAHIWAVKSLPDLKKGSPRRLGPPRVHQNEMFRLNSFGSPEMVGHPCQGGAYSPKPKCKVKWQRWPNLSLVGPQAVWVFPTFLGGYPFFSFWETKVSQFVPVVSGGSNFQLKTTQIRQPANFRGLTAI